MCVPGLLPDGVLYVCLLAGCSPERKPVADLLALAGWLYVAISLFKKEEEDSGGI